LAFRRRRRRRRRHHHHHHHHHQQQRADSSSSSSSSGNGNEQNTQEEDVDDSNNSSSSGSSSGSSADKARQCVLDGMNILETVAENFNFAKRLENLAKYEYKRYSTIIKSSKQANVLAALCLYHVCRVENVSRDCRLICKLFNIETRDFWNLDKKVHNAAPAAGATAAAAAATTEEDACIDGIWYSQQKLLKTFGINRVAFEQLARVARTLQRSFCRQKNTLFAACLLLWGKRHQRAQLSSRCCSQISGVSTSATCRLVNELRGHVELERVLRSITPAAVAADEEEGQQQQQQGRQRLRIRR